MFSVQDLSPDDASSLRKVIDSNERLQNKPDQSKSPSKHRSRAKGKGKAVEVVD